MNRPTQTQTIALALCFCLIFGLAFYLRQFTFWLPHWQGDQSQYVMLAMKLGARGGITFADYNLSKINVESVKVGSPAGTEIIYPYSIPSGRGFVLDAYYAQGLKYFDMPFFYKAPMLPAALSLSHTIFSGIKKPYAVVKSNLGQKVLRLKPGLYLKTQFWAAVIPFVSSLLVLLMIYFWTKRNIGDKAALFAAFIMATNPVSILTANRVWTEDLTLLFLVPAMFLYRHGWRAKRSWVCAVAGVFLGLSVLTNQRMILAIASLGLYTLLMLRSEGIGWIRCVFVTDRKWWAFTAGWIATTLPWFWNIYQRYGNPLWQPEIFVRMHYGKEIQSLGGDANMGAWYNTLLMQPHGLIYYSVGTVAICWAFIAGYATIRDAAIAGGSAVAKRPTDDRPIFMWCWIGVFAIYFFSQRTGEYRYLFPVYPALAIASGWMWTRWEARLSRITAQRWIATVVIAGLLAVSGAYSVRLILPILWKEKNLITAPWY
jgi:4-amino-4-deoxy-L-arabinose transferase-like glycosyltransferase